MHSVATRRKARQLEQKLGCTIEIDVFSGDDRHLSYWVYGPEDVYDVDGGRRDPCDGDHVACDWDEVLVHLWIYQVDLHFHRHGIMEAVSNAIYWLCYGRTGFHLLEAWINGNQGAGMILADWLSDEGRDDLGTAVRTAARGE